MVMVTGTATTDTATATIMADPTAAITVNLTWITIPVTMIAMETIFTTIPDITICTGKPVAHQVAKLAI